MTERLAEEPRAVHVPAPPDGAPREQLFEYAALCGVCAATGGSVYNDALSRTADAYIRRWHPEVKATLVAEQDTMEDL